MRFAGDARSPAKRVGPRGIVPAFARLRGRACWRTVAAMTTASVLDSRYAWFRLCVTMVIAIFANVGIWIYIAIMPAVAAEFGVDRASASAPYAITMIGFALGNFGIGRIVDRFGVTAALTGAACLSAAGYGLASLSGSVLALSLLQFFIGFGTGAGFGPLMADISHWFLRRRGMAVAIVASGNYLSGAIWPLAMGGVLASHGWRGVYVVLAVVTVAVMIPLALLLRRSVPAQATAAADDVRQALALSAGVSPRGLQYLLALAGFACCMAMAMPQVHIVALCVDFGFGAGVGAEMLSLMLLGGVVSRLASGAIADRFGGVRTVLLGSVLQCVALFLYLPFDGLVSLYIVSLIFGLSQGGIVPSYAVVVREYLPPKEAGARVGFVIMSTIIGMAVGGWVSGWIFDLTGSYQMAFLNGIAWNFLNIGIMLLLLSRTGRAAMVRA